MRCFVKLQLMLALSVTRFLDGCLPAHRACQSTETAPLRVLNDLLADVDDGQVSTLTLLELSAAFDTIDRDTLFHPLEHVFGIQNSALSFF